MKIVLQRSILLNNIKQKQNIANTAEYVQFVVLHRVFHLTLDNLLGGI